MFSTKIQNIINSKKCHSVFQGEWFINKTGNSKFQKTGIRFRESESSTTCHSSKKVSQ